MPQEKEWKEEFYKICKQLNLREETVSGFDEIGLMQNFISSLLSSQAHALKEESHKQYALGQREGIDYMKERMRAKLKEEYEQVQKIVLEALGESSALFMSQECKGTEIVMPTEELNRIGENAIQEIL